MQTMHVDEEGVSSLFLRPLKVFSCCRLEPWCQREKMVRALLGYHVPHRGTTYASHVGKGQKDAHALALECETAPPSIPVWKSHRLYAEAAPRAARGSKTAALAGNSPEDGGEIHGGGTRGGGDLASRSAESAGQESSVAAQTGTAARKHSPDDAVIGRVMPWREP